MGGRESNALRSLTWEISFFVRLQKYRDRLLACEDHLDLVSHGKWLFVYLSSIVLRILVGSDLR